MHVISYSSPDYKLGIYWVGQGQLKTIPKELCTIKTFLALKFEHHSIHHWTSVTTVLVSQQEIELRKKITKFNTCIDEMTASMWTIFPLKNWDEY